MFFIAKVKDNPYIYMDYLSPLLNYKMLGILVIFIENTRLTKSIFKNPLILLVHGICKFA
jgi:hypothetical protein